VTDRIIEETVKEVDEYDPSLIFTSSLLGYDKED